VDYEHVVYFTHKDGLPYIAIDRVFPNGRRDFCTHCQLSAVADEASGLELMDKISSWLGNTLCIDNPQFRQHIHIEPKAGM
jgi:hypothetical protein